MTQTYLSAMDEHHAEWIPEHGTPAYIRDHSIAARLQAASSMSAFKQSLSDEEKDRIRLMSEAVIGRTVRPGSYPRLRRFAHHKDDAPTPKVARWHWEGGTCPVVCGEMRLQKPEMTLDGADFANRVDAGEVVCKTCLFRFNNA
jgi:hypothetical protein